MYAMECKRFDIGHVMGFVNQFMANFKQSHWIILKHIFIIWKTQWIWFMFEKKHQG